MSKMVGMIFESGLKDAESRGVRELGAQISLAGDSKGTDEIKVDSPLPAYIDFNEKAGSLLIDFGSIGEETLESDALALVSLSGRDLAGIEILLDDKKVVKRLSEILRPRSYRE